jgi:hypothetical protein
VIPKNKRHLIVNKEYSRLPYWTDEGFDDVQRQVSQKYVQDNYGKFAESENQPPYLSDADYQGLEYEYQDPQFPDIPDLNKDTAPKGTCYQLWLSLFGDATGAFIPTASEWNKLNEYAKKCPLIYMPHICCLNMKISGPDSVAPGDTVEYSVSGGGHGCAYDIDAKRGEFIGYKYTAPTTPGSDRISIKPWMSDDQHTICAYKDILIEGGCKGTVHATTPQMQVGASQTLYITGGSEADTYYWSTTTGSLSASEGTSVTYTAPATNPNCASNPTITVTCGGATIGTLKLAVNAYTATNVGIIWYYESQGTCWLSGQTYNIWNICAQMYGLACSGELTYNPAWNPQCRNGAGASCAAAFANGEQLVISGQTGSTAYCYAQGVRFGDWCDSRSEEMKTAGCCPAQLL